MNFSLNLTGNLQQSATADANALQKLYDQTRAEEKALAALEKQLKNAGKGGTTNVETGRKLSKSIEDQKSKIAGLTDEMVKLGGAGFTPQIEKTSKLTAGALAMATAVGGVLASAFSFLGQKAKEAFGEIIKFSEARGDFERGLESIYGSEEAAKHTYDVVAAITDKVAVSQEKALQIFDRLEKAGVQNGDQAVKATEAIATAEAARKGAGEALQGVLERAGKSRFFSINRDELRAAGLTFKELATSISKNTGQGVKDAELALRFGKVKLGQGIDALKDAVDKKLGKVAEKKFMTVGNQLQRLKDSLASVFSGADTTKLAKGISKIVELFSATTTDGQKLREIVSKIFDGIGSAIEAVAPYVEVFFLGIEIALLKIYNATYPIRKALKDVFGGEENGLATFENALLGINAVLGVVANTIGETIGLAIRNAAEAFNMLKSVVDAVVYALTGQWSKAGEAIVDGLIGGLTRTAVRLYETLKGIGKGALSAFEHIFDIRSPSRVMAKRGEYINEGLAKGLEQSSDKPAKAMAEPPAMPQLGSVANDNSRSSAVNFAEGAVVLKFEGGNSQDHDAIKATVTQVFIDLFEQVGVSMGARPA